MRFFSSPLYFTALLWGESSGKGPEARCHEIPQNDKRVGASFVCALKSPEPGSMCFFFRLVAGLLLVDCVIAHNQLPCVLSSLFIKLQTDCLQINALICFALCSTCWRHERSQQRHERRTCGCVLFVCLCTR